MGSPPSDWVDLFLDSGCTRTETSGKLVVRFCVGPEISPGENVTRLPLPELFLDPDDVEEGVVAEADVDAATAWFSMSTM